MLGQNLSHAGVVGGRVRHMGILRLERVERKARVMALHEGRQPRIRCIDRVDAGNA